MKPKHLFTALAIFVVTGTVIHSQNPAEAWQGDVIKNLTAPTLWLARYSVDRGRSEQESLIHKMGTDAYSDMSLSGPIMRSDAARSQQGPIPGGQPYTGEYKAGSPSNESRYGPNPSDNYFRKESSGSSGGPYGGSVYGGGPTTPSADPMIKELSREPSMR